MMLPPNVSRSKIAAQSRGSVNVFVQPLELSFDAMADRILLLPFPGLAWIAAARVMTAGEQSGDPVVPAWLII